MDTADIVYEITKQCDLESLFTLYNVSQIFRKYAKSIIYSRNGRKLINKILSQNISNTINASAWRITQIRKLLLFTDGNLILDRAYNIDFQRITKGAPDKVVYYLINSLPIKWLVPQTDSKFIDSIGKQSIGKFVTLYQIAKNKSELKLILFCDERISKLLYSVTGLCDFIDAMNLYKYDDLRQTRAAIKHLCENLYPDFFDRNCCDVCNRYYFMYCKCDFGWDNCDYPQNFSQLQRLRDLSYAIDFIYDMVCFRDMIAETEDRIESARESFWN